MTEIQPPTGTPDDLPVIHSWSITFRGEYTLKEGFPVFEPALKLNSSFTEWHGHFHKAAPDEPVMIILDGNPELIKDWETQPVGGNIGGVWPWILFDRTGLMGTVRLNLSLDPDLNARNIQQQIGSTENVSLRATIRNEWTLHNDEHSGTINEPIFAFQANHIDELPIDVPPQDEEMIDLSTFVNVRPILFLDQGLGGFILLAEAVDLHGYRRILFSIMDAPRLSDPASRVGSQQWVVSRPYFVHALSEYTIRVHQDGDITRPHIDTNSGSIYRYLEFWVNNLPLGIHFLPSTYFPFKRDISRVGIGCWPIEDGALYFKGGMGEIIVDPHGICPCAG